MAEKRGTTFPWPGGPSRRAAGSPRPETEGGGPFVAPPLSIQAPPQPRPVEDSELLRLRGEAALRSGRWTEAKRYFKRALKLAPEQPALRGALGAAYLVAGRYARAAVEFQRAFKDLPAEGDAHTSLGAILRNMGRVEEAIAHQRRAVSLRPASVDAHRELGDALRETGEMQEAIRAYQQALALKPDDLAASLNLAGSLRHAGRMSEAVAAFRRVSALRPEFPDTFVNLGDTLLALGQPAAARLQYDRALALAPDHAEAHWARSRLALLLGEAATAWDDFAWRDQVLDAPLPPSGAPAWAGEPLEGRTLLVHGERWLSDTLQFVRYVPRIAALGGHVVLAVQPPLVDLLHGFAGADAVVALDRPLPGHDLRTPLGGLPGLFREDPLRLPFAAPYLAGAPGRPAAAGHPLRVGLVWSGDPANPCDRERSCPVEELAGVCRMPGVRFVNLQAGPRGGEIGRLARAVETTPLDPGDMRLLARGLAGLDLVIGVDTAPVHLAAAMGLPVWLMLPFVPDWRWMLGRTDSPWYPTVRLFRPSSPGDWREVLAAVEASLAELAYPDA